MESVESSDLVAVAVRVVTGLSSGAATGVGTEIGQTVAGLVREKLSRSSEGQHALDATEERPQDPETVARLREAVAAHLTEDPDFAARLTAALAGPPPGEAPRQYHHSVVIDGGSKVRGNTISLGPVTFNNTPSGRTALALAALALAVLAGLLVFTATELVDSDDGRGSNGPAAQHPGGTGGPAGEDGEGSGSGSGNGGASEGEAGDGDAGGSDGGASAGGLDGDAAMAPLTSADRLLEVLPDTASLPTGWTELTAPSADVSGEDDGSTYRGEAEYAGTYSMETDFIVAAFPDTDAARRAFDTWSEEARTDGATPLAMPRIGDETFAFALTENRGDGYNANTTRCTLVRTGTVLTAIVGEDNESRRYDSQDLESMTRLLSTRALTAQTS
ncbi:hypothetical protein HUT18_18075 [Streptomyces sp. NA04227]|uniref:hypothetical protein n=1 Tax=Streptomyces sp. NA04227 TaxID=2742136 RepID=UPI001591356C|nr:hypothetical protein [Streptomyces sp. NA04227]QKW08006.1 hypothetical protein HUT18_18075 [Streptomyces sp. NA04227]